MRATWLGNVLHLAGLQVVELDGWKTRGRELLQIDAVILHHTATGKNWSDAAVGKLLRDGRIDLPGPLAQLGLARDGKFWVVAAGRCNHNGFGEHGNQTIGIEAFNDGKGEPWPDVQLDAWQRGTAALLRHCELSSGLALGHRETDPRRKIDPFGVDLPAFRRNVQRHLAVLPPLLAPTVTDYPEAIVRRIDLAIDTDDKGYGYRDLNTPPREVVSVISNTANPPDSGYKPIPDVARLDVAGKTRVVVEEAVPNGRIDVSVWVA